MNREEAKELLPIIQAFADGKTIEIYDDEDGEWKPMLLTSPEFNCRPSCYRIKPELQYRPFNRVKEVWGEMHKHTDFGWVHYKDPDIASDNRRVILSISGDDGNLSFVVRGFRNSYCIAADEMFENYEFIDGTPFGIKE